MSLESPVADRDAPESSYLDEDAGSLDSAGRRLALWEDDHSSLSERVRVLADVGRFLDEFFQLTGAQLRAAGATGRVDGVPHRPGGTGVRVLPVEQVVEAHLPELFASDRIEARAVFRVTRQAGIAANPEVDDMLTSVERQLRLGRHGTAVRLEVEAGIPDDALQRLMGELDLGWREVYPVDGLMGMADLATLPLPDGPEQAPGRPVAPARLRPSGG